jgi:hypothetical protein
MSNSVSRILSPIASALQCGSMSARWPVTPTLSTNGTGGGPRAGSVDASARLAALIRALSFKVPVF